jgi:O-succinylbenzoate synthase
MQEKLNLQFPKIDQAELLLFPLPLTAPFETSFGSIDHREIIVLRLQAGGITAYGECAADVDPLYSSETNSICWEILKKYLTPMLKDCRTISQFLESSSPIRGHNMSKATIELGLWDLLAKSQNVPLFRLWNGTKQKIPCGVSVGLQKDIPSLLRKIESHLEEGYRRIKIKIKPGRDIDLIKAIRSELPDIPLMADANAAYTLDQVGIMKNLDQFNLMMIEQPLHYEDIYEHSILQAQVRTPICLDESVHSLRAARAALQLKSCKIINIKTGRVGGHTESIGIHDLAQSQNIPVWCGGMLESGIGRAHNLALASLPNFSLPGDTSASSRYWHRDIINPPVTIDREGFATIPDRPGIGYDVDTEFLNSLVQQRETIRF